MSELFGDSTRYIEITGVDLELFVKEAYDLSRPQGMGFLHYTPGPLPQDIVEDLLSMKWSGHVKIDIDYVLGRAVKMAVWEEDDRMFIRSDWFDHSEYALRELLHRVGVKHET